MPRSDHEEAVDRLRQVADALEGVQGSFIPTFAQRRMDEDGYGMKAFASYEARLNRGCGAGRLSLTPSKAAEAHIAISDAQPRMIPIGWAGCG